MGAAPAWWLKWFRCLLHSPFAVCRCVCIASMWLQPSSHYFLGQLRPQIPLHISIDSIWHTTPGCTLGTEFCAHCPVPQQFRYIEGPSHPWEKCRIFHIFDWLCFYGAEPHLMGSSPTCVTFSLTSRALNTYLFNENITTAEKATQTARNLILFKK